MDVCSQINLLTHTRQNMKDRLRDLEDIMRKTNVHLMGIREKQYLIDNGESSKISEIYKSSDSGHI